MSKGKELHLGSFDKQVAECIDGHENHICALAQKVAIGKLKELVDQPNYICQTCARVAKEKVNLCKPKSLDTISDHE
jgi:hypothetical protein